jgi:hypothetical protein
MLSKFQCLFRRMWQFCNIMHERLISELLPSMQYKAVTMVTACIIHQLSPWLMIPIPKRKLLGDKRLSQLFIWYKAINDKTISGLFTDFMLFFSCHFLGLLLWNQTRQQWVGNRGRSSQDQQHRERKIRLISLNNLYVMEPQNLGIILWNPLKLG